MTGLSRESTSNVASEQTFQNSQDTSSQVIHFINDSHSLQIIEHNLNGANCVEWSQLVVLVIDEKGRLEYLTNEAASLKIGMPAYKKWKSKDSMVKACLLNSMEPTISRVYLYYKTSNAIWEMVEEMYSDLGILPRFSK